MRKKKEGLVGVELGLAEDDKKMLHEIAKTTIFCQAKGEKIPQFEVTLEILKEKKGAFVSLHKHGQLRGCIGNIHAQKPLYLTVKEMAKAAAFEDPRFTQVTLEELEDLQIEISVLTPLKKVKDLKEIEVGKHGIYIVKGYCSGLLLPQVASEYGWDRETFLEHTCYKAGLPKDAWKDEDTEIFIFSAQVF